MSYRKGLLYSMLVLLAFVAGGCARAARDTTGFVLENTVTVQAPFEETWQSVKSVLREQGFDLYTRDKRGTFVAFTKMKRRYLQPKRVKYTVELDAVSSEETRIYIETVNQIYGVTLLTYPGWHDRKTSDNAGALAILEAVQSKLRGSAAAPSGQDTVS